MNALKLAKLPNRTPVKVTSAFPPEVHDMLQDYARIYAETYGAEEKMEALVPYIVEAFLSADSSFKKARKALHKTPSTTTRPPIKQSN